MAQLEKERGISKQVLIEAISAALIAASRKKFGDTDNLEVKIDEKTGETHVFANKEVVDKVITPILEIKLEDAKKINKSAKLEDIVAVDVTPEDFGRIAAQTAKQVIIQRIREAEKSSVYDEFKDKEGQVVTGTVQRQEYKNYLINLGRIEALLIAHEQIPRESYSPRDRIKVYVVEVKKTSKGPQIIVSRTHPGLLKALFTLEVPEIQDGIIEIMGVASEAGFRSKVAVKSNDPDIGAVGTCVGHMGGRIQNIVKELGNEKIDIIEWDEDSKKYIQNALKPAKVAKIVLTEEKNEKEEIGKVAKVIVAEDQLSLAIGKSGQNVRLAAKLTGWKVDVLTINSPEAEKIKQLAAESPREAAEEKMKANIKARMKEKLQSKLKENQKEKEEENAKKTTAKKKKSEKK
ncbi:MAG: transcription termination factor NusA [Candidatus Margulisbacteria bacterium]|nr:transcription termination factor NusA [Candidatus Margulisiibacteriota bacterium]